MSRVPSLTGKELVAVPRKAVFALVRARGSHHRLEHADGRKTVVPVHAGETIGPGLLGKILRDCAMTREDLDALL
ncbi:MAG: type II toxin-antitoxin system HicA family toxin [Pseudomonadota bacterium]